METKQFNAIFNSLSDEEKKRLATPVTTRFREILKNYCKSAEEANKLELTDEQLKERAITSNKEADALIETMGSEVEQLALELTQNQEFATQCRIDAKEMIEDEIRDWLRIRAMQALMEGLVQNGLSLETNGTIN